MGSSNNEGETTDGSLFGQYAGILMILNWKVFRVISIYGGNNRNENGSACTYSKQILEFEPSPDSESSYDPNSSVYLTLSFQIWNSPPQIS